MKVQMHKVTKLRLPNFLIEAKPFLKWAGGKGQLIDTMVPFFPPELEQGRIKRYVEPFIGGGAVFFYIAQHYSVTEFYIADVNEELMLLYKTIQRDVDGLIEALYQIESHYFSLNAARRVHFYYQVRDEFNSCRPHINWETFEARWIMRSAQIIFLNRTCYNGLFRVNSKGEFNVPYGDYKRPRICDKDNLKAVSNILKNATIRCGDFTECFDFVDKDTFVYFDPPYRPISKTASFTSYSRYEFDDKAQCRLANFFRRLDAKGAKLMLSNSDPQNENTEDLFFEHLYKGFHIFKVNANRMINSNPSKRGPITEILITNYPPSHLS